MLCFRYLPKSTAASGLSRPKRLYKSVGLCYSSGQAFMAVRIRLMLCRALFLASALFCVVEGQGEAVGGADYGAFQVGSVDFGVLQGGQDGLAGVAVVVVGAHRYDGISGRDGKDEGRCGRAV